MLGTISDDTSVKITKMPNVLGDTGYKWGQDTRRLWFLPESEDTPNGITKQILKLIYIVFIATWFQQSLKGDIFTII